MHDADTVCAHFDFCICHTFCLCVVCACVFGGTFTAPSASGLLLAHHDEWKQTQHGHEVAMLHRPVSCTTYGRLHAELSLVVWWHYHKTHKATAIARSMCQAVVRRSRSGRSKCTTVVFTTFGQICREEGVGSGAYRPKPPGLALLGSMRKRQPRSIVNIFNLKAVEALHQAGTVNVGEKKSN